MSERPAWRVAMVADFDGVHARTWLRCITERGHDVRPVSYYAPRPPIAGAVALRTETESGSRGEGAREARGRKNEGVFLPPSSLPLRRTASGIARLAHAVRYRRAGLGRAVREMRADAVHAHFVVEHGFYAAFAGCRPLVVTAWGSDILVEPRRDPLSRMIARWTLRRADAVTSNNGYLAERAIALGARREGVSVVTLGADRYFLEQRERSVNVRRAAAERPAVILSTRAHEPLYNIGEIIDACGAVARRRPNTELVVAHRGSLTEELQRRAMHMPGRVSFAGFLEREALREAMTNAEVFVSVPSSDGTSVALLQAMAAGCFPIVSDLPTQRELVEDGVSGFRVPLHGPDVLAGRIVQALDDAELRRSAAARNRAFVEEHGLNETQMARLDEVYARLAAAPSR